MAARLPLPCGCDAGQAQYDVVTDSMVCTRCRIRISGHQVRQQEKQMFGSLGNALSQQGLMNDLANSQRQSYLGAIGLQNMQRDAAEVERLRKLAEEEQQLLCLLTQGD